VKVHGKLTVHIFFESVLTHLPENYLN